MPLYGTINDRIGYIRSELMHACKRMHADDREWVLALIVTEIENAYRLGQESVTIQHVPTPVQDLAAGGN